MKKLLLTLMLCLLVAGCNEEICQPTAWLTTGPDLDSEQNQVTGRLGILNNDGVEFGLESSYLDGIDGKQSYGAYALQQFTAVDIGTQYVGAHAGIIDVEEGNTYGFISGVLIPVSPQIDTVIEYQFNEYQGELKEVTGTDDDHKIYAGLRVRL